MHEGDGHSVHPAGSPFRGVVPLAEARVNLARLEALQDEVAQRVARLRAILPPDRFRLVWALRDAEDRLGLAERLLAERHLVEELARHLPEQAPTIRATACELLG